MKAKINLLLAFTALIIGSSCTKEYNNPVHTTQTTGSNPATHHYGSMKDFYSVNSVKSQTFTVDVATGTAITTSQGTLITIPASAFVTLGGIPVTGTVNLEYKELYKKSDMLFSDKSTVLFDGRPLKSGGEFFIKATSNGAAVQLASGAHITVEQPLNGFAFDPGMAAFVALTDTFKWVPANNAAVDSGGGYSSYIFDLYTFSSPEDSGTWCNSDCSTFFSAYPQTSLTMHANEDPSLYYTDVFLIFSDINTMIHVYSGSGGDFPYMYAPEGLSCTAVAVGVRDSVLYSAFTPITIGSNQTVNFSLHPTTDENFKQQIDALN